jgi:hypothetical protein
MRLSTRYSTSTVRALLQLTRSTVKSQIMQLPGCNDQWHETCLGSEVKFKDISPSPTFQLPNILHEF